MLWRTLARRHRAGARGARLAAADAGPARRASSASSRTRPRRRRSSPWRRPGRRCRASTRGGAASSARRACACTRPTRPTRRSRRRASSSASGRKAFARSRWTTRTGWTRPRWRRAIAEDRAAGLTPFAVTATVGTTVHHERSIPCRPSPTSATGKGSGCTWTRRTAGSAAVVPELRWVLDGLRARRLAGREPAQVAVRAHRPLGPVHAPPGGRAAPPSASCPTTCARPRTRWPRT